MWFLVVVLFKLHIAVASIAFEYGQTNLRRVLVVSPEFRYRQHPFHDHAPDHGLFTQSWSETQDRTSAQATRFEGILDPRQKVGIQSWIK